MNRTILIALVIAPLLGACATGPSEADLRIALARPCDNDTDKMPWVLADEWDDGDNYKPDARFTPEGVMIYAYNGSTYDNGRWELSGDVLHIDTNKHYADYEGRFNGETGSGTMKNTPGNTGTWTLERSCKG